MSKHYINIIILFLIFVSCSQMQMELQEVDNEHPLLTKGEIVSVDDYMVDEGDISNYIHSILVCENNDLGGSLSSNAYEYDGEVAFYILNFENGWQIISSDKRGPILLASGRESYLSIEEINPATRMWLDILADDIAYRRRFPEEYYSKAPDDIYDKEQYCLNTWSAINSEPEYVISEGISTKGGRDHPLLPTGHYELVSTYYTYDFYEDTGHLITWPWHQGDPFNRYCPYKYDYSDRCPAGCLSIAAGQILYYSHYKIGRPVSSPSSGYCVGDEYNYNSNFSDFANTWDLMNNTNDYVGLFVGNLGRWLGTIYHSNGSSAFSFDIPDVFSDYFGIDCTYQNGFDADTVFTSLQAGWPVIFSGQRLDGILLSGHSFLIDGYVSYVQTTHYCYEWVPDPIILGNPNSINAEVPSFPEPYETTSISSPYLYSLRLRWGYADPFEETATYSTDGIWTYPNRTPYQYLRNMIYGFNVIGNE